MFGKELSNDTKREVSQLLGKDIDIVEMSSVTTLRFSVEQLYDRAESNVIQGAVNNSVIEVETRRYNDIRDVYSLLMQDIESHLDKGGLLI